MPSWPSSLPPPLHTGLSEKAQPNIVAFRPEVGPPIIRRRGTARSRVLSMTFRLSPAQLNTFISFFEGDLKDGALRFDMLHPVTGAMAQWVFESPEDPWSYDTVDLDIYDLSVTLRMLP